MSDGNDGNDGTGTGWEATAAPFHLSVSLSHMWCWHWHWPLELSICDSWFLTLDSWGRGLISWSPSPPLLRVRFPIPGPDSLCNALTNFSHSWFPHFWSRKSQSAKFFKHKKAYKSRKKLICWHKKWPKSWKKVWNLTLSTFKGWNLPINVMVGCEQLAKSCKSLPLFGLLFSCLTILPPLTHWVYWPMWQPNTDWRAEHFQHCTLNILFPSIFSIFFKKHMKNCCQ